MVSSPLRTRIKAESDSTPWLTGQAVKARTVIDLLDGEILKFSTYCSPTESEIELRKQVVEILGKIIRGNLKNWNAEMVINGTTQLDLDDEPIQVSILSTRFNGTNPVQLLTELFNLLISTTFIDKAELIESFSLPYLNIVTTSEYGCFLINIYIATSYKMQETEVMEKLLRGLKETKRARFGRLFYLVRVLLNSKGNGLTEEENGGIGKVALFCLVFSYLQLDKKLTAPLPGSDLLGFLQHYTQLNLARYTVAVTEGRLIKHQTVQKGSDIIYIQDLVNPSINLTRMVTKSRFIMGTFQSTYAYLLPFVTNSSNFDLFRLNSEKKSVLFGIGIKLHPNYHRVRKLRFTRAERGIFYSNGDGSDDEEDEIPLAELIFRSKSIAFRAGPKRLSVGNLNELMMNGSHSNLGILQQRRSMMF